MSFPLLLDEMFSGTIAQQLRAKGHDVQAVVADPSLASLPDGQILARAAATGRALVTANIKDFIPLDVQYRAAGQEHAGLILVQRHKPVLGAEPDSAVAASGPWGALIPSRQRLANG